ncbi:hypothetical protein AJ80_04618 [Polytolypa hystricis UAMH7299]|uniref:Zn(2)-C6 fungal-type domain-containing protein n=1 Tax=Polytolypa hystricis (strain UAMH7299) TaxID=1447883 RepID=A0A2B7YBM3_POLH7|nr:hypothetical protein AJ80_04618 [Polytolypa hystricis UAMH7299]
MAETITSGPQLAPRPRQKRSQVVRACDWCRKHRIKCDNNLPCSNCKNRDAECSNDVIRATSLPHAYREIERLRRQVRELEHELHQERSRAANNHNNHNNLEHHTPPASDSSPPELSQKGLDWEYGDAQKFWGGIHIKHAQSTRETWYGPSSLFYFIGRVTSFLSSTLHQTQSADEILPNASARALFDDPTSNSRNGAGRRLSNSAAAGRYLSPTQEEYFLDLFWQSYHTSLFPILNEAEFKEHYRSLWVTSDNVRKPSALVDIVIAMCMQHGLSMLPATRQKPIVDNDATVAGQWYYRRCQALLEYELESPTISTLQCYILCSVYLCCGSFHNMADNFCALSVRVAHMLGLHLEPPSTLPDKGRELRKRLWWALYVFDSKVSMKLGRPFQVHRSNAEPSLPDDQPEAAAQSGSHFASLGGNVTWLTFNLQNTKLFLTVREAHTAFYKRNLNIRDDETVWDNLQALEAHAEFMRPYAKTLEDWANDVPNALRTKRQGNGSSLSMDGSSLEIEQFAPLWLQRQRIILELMYHTLSSNLCRPFIAFGSAPKSTTTDLMATKCAHHAIALTQITHQVLSSTSILAGWHEAFQWQWYAAMTLVGFVLAYPQSAPTLAARRAIDQSVAVLDIFGDSFAIGIQAANIVRDLGTKVDFLLQQNQAGRNASSGNVSTRDQIAPTANFRGLEEGDLMSISFDNLTAESMQDIFQVALDIDQCSNLDMLWLDGGGILSEQWPQ